MPGRSCSEHEYPHLDCKPCGDLAVAFKQGEQTFRTSDLSVRSGRCRDAKDLVLEKLSALPIEPLHSEMADCEVQAAMRRVVHRLGQSI